MKAALKKELLGLIASLNEIVEGLPKQQALEEDTALNILERYRDNVRTEMKIEISEALEDL